MPGIAHVAAHPLDGALQLARVCLSLPAVLAAAVVGRAAGAADRGDAVAGEVALDPVAKIVVALGDAVWVGVERLAGINQNVPAAHLRGGVVRFGGIERELVERRCAGLWFLFDRALAGIIVRILRGAAVAGLQPVGHAFGVS